MNAIEPGRLYAVDELADILHLHPQTVYRWLREGKIKRAPVKSGRRVLILGREVLEQDLQEEEAANDGPEPGSEEARQQAAAILDRMRQEAENGDTA